jgi:NADPH:quinone reductase-like Zn-dependent oxidoreductase
MHHLTLQTGTDYLESLSLFVLCTDFSNLKKNVLGADVSGVVKKVGQAVTQFKPGDEVFGEIGTGGFAEYATANVDQIAHKPKTVSFKDAAALPVAAITAYQAIEDYYTINERSKVLINGASGGVGHYATQLVKHKRAHITAVCSSAKMDFVKKLGADETIDYKKTSFINQSNQYDVILDCIGNHNSKLLLNPLKDNGKAVVIGFTGFENMLPAMLSGKNGRLISFTAKPNPRVLKELANLTANGILKPHIEKEYSLSQLPEAMEYLLSMRVKGKLIVHVK